MKIYVVGGAVRDALMGFQPKDVDYVAVGATKAELVASMPNLAPETVGNDFPVFICKETGSEYAMARRERKVGAGYGGFTVDFSSDVTIEEDLSRRDLTINAIAAENIFGGVPVGVVDPFGGMEDIRNKVLRPVSEAFVEDPVRVLRVARFRARMGAEWTISSAFGPMMRNMVKSGELSSLTKERVYKEMSRALLEPHPRLFFDTLLQLDVLHVIFPQIFKMKTAREWLVFHPEGDAYEHTMLVLTEARKRATYEDTEYNLGIMFNALLHDMGKSETKFEHLPSHPSHESRGLPLISEFAERYSLPKKITNWALKTSKYHMYGHRLNEISNKKIVDMFDDLGVMKSEETVTLLETLFNNDEDGRYIFPKTGFKYSELLWCMVDEYRKVKFVDLFPEGCDNTNIIRDKMRKAKINAVRKARKKCGYV